jgi:hypothetical protein
MTKGDYKKDIETSSNLKEDWERQAGLYLYYSLQLSDAEDEKNKAEENVDVVKAQLDRDIRDDPKAFEIEKITEPVIKSTIFLQDEYKNATELSHKKAYEMSILKGVIRAFDHKKKALENLVILHMAGYNAEPKPSRKRE